MSTASLSRRRFLSGRLQTEISVVIPPGTSLASILTSCTACGTCEERCPTGVIGIDHGIPALDFSRSECTFCGVCSDVCPEPVFSSERISALPVMASIGERCLAKAGIACEACRDFCPESAIVFRPRIGGPFTPEVLSDRCSGCGACVAPCPAGAVAMLDRTKDGVHV